MLKDSYVNSVMLITLSIFSLNFGLLMDLFVCTVQNLSPSSHFSIRKGLLINIISLYGEQMLKEIKNSDKQRSKKNPLPCYLIIMTSCRDHDILLAFNKLSYHSKSIKPDRILHKGSKFLLFAEIQRTRKQIAQSRRTATGETHSH